MSRYSLPGGLKDLREAVLCLFSDGQGHCFEQNQLVSFDVIARHLNNQVGVNTDPTLTLGVSDALLSEAFRNNDQSSPLGGDLFHYSIPLSYLGVGSSADSDEPRRGVSGRRSTSRVRRIPSKLLDSDEGKGEGSDEDEATDDEAESDEEVESDEEEESDGEEESDDEEESDEDEGIDKDTNSDEDGG